MTIMFYRSNPETIHYDRSYVKNVYALKQSAGQSVINTIDIGADVTEDVQLILKPTTGSENYYNCLARDYLEGYITDEEFYGHLEDLFYSKGGSSDEVSSEKKQAYFNWILEEAHNGILNYYLKQNSEEGLSRYPLEAQSPCIFYYNTDYHYQHLEQLEKFIQRSNELADKLGLSGIEDSLRTNIKTVNGRQSVGIALSVGQFIDLDVPPPRGMKIAIGTKYEPYWASIMCEGKEYKVSVPFSYGLNNKKINYECDLASLLSMSDIPDKYMNYIKNIRLIQYGIARFDPLAPYISCEHPKLFQAISAYDEAAMALSEK